MQTPATLHLYISGHGVSKHQSGRAGLFCFESVAFIECCFLLCTCILADSQLFSYIEKDLYKGISIQVFATQMIKRFIQTKHYSGDNLGIIRQNKA
jgi:hypothetical protein